MDFNETERQLFLKEAKKGAIIMAILFIIAMTLLYFINE